jgi:propionate catabolism operon transcriptional regulator
MANKKFQIGIFATSQSLIERIQVITASQEDNIHISKQGLDDAIPVGKEMEQKGIEVIISRRGTAHLLRENLRIPVLSFPHRSLDILISLKKAAQINKRILLPVFRQELGGMSIFEDLLHIDLVQAIYQDKVSLERAVAKAKHQGCKVAVGGSVTQTFAEDHGLAFVEIRTSEEDIAATIENAKSAAQSGREQKASTRQYRSIIDAASDGIIVVDTRGRITTINATAKKLLSITENNVFGQPISQYIHGGSFTTVLTNKKPMFDRLVSINNDSYVFNYLPVLLADEAIGVVSTFRDIGNVMRTERVVRRSLSKGLIARYKLDDLVFESPVMRDAINIAKQYAKTDSTILISGETGTGKEIFAHGMHDVSARSHHPFVSINCAALPEQLLESELFGYEEGAFTGSRKGGKPGLFEIAHQGTIFLDEINSTPQLVQIRLLRVLQEREVMRVGGDRKIPVDVRVIAAASQDLGTAVIEDNFREDLFFRLNVLLIEIPPLREKKEDIPVLLNFFIQHFSNRHGFHPISLPDAYIQQLMDYTWPGNVRQLRNFTERLVMNCSLQCSNDILDILYRELIEYPRSTLTDSLIAEQSTSFKQRMRIKVLEDEKAIIMDALEKTKYHKAKTAEMLHISRSTLWRKMKEMGLG